MRRFLLFRKHIGMLLVVTASFFPYLNCARSGVEAEVLTSDSTSQSNINPPPLSNSCQFMGRNFSSGETLIGYLSNQAIFPQTCGSPAIRTCQADGTFDGSLPLNEKCEQLCRHPDDPTKTLKVSEQYSFYTKSSGQTESECEASKMAVKCLESGGLDQALPASRYSTCKIAGQNCSYPTGSDFAIPTALTAGGTVKGYSLKQATSPQLCGNQITRTCQAAGIWDGPIPVFKACKQFCKNPFPGGADIESGQSLTYYLKSTGPSADCQAQTSRCDATSGLYVPSLPATVFASCAVIAPPVVNVLVAKPTTLKSGQSTALTWITTGATSLSLSGIGDVTGKTSVVVSPQNTTIYKLTANNIAGTSTKEVTVTVVMDPAPPEPAPAPAPAPTPAPAPVTFKYKEYFDKTYALNAKNINIEFNTGMANDYYNTTWHHNAFLNMYEATEDVAYLEQSLAWAELQVTKAVVIDNQGFRNWKSDPGDTRYASVPVSHFLYDLHGTTEIARLVRIILTNPTLKAKYGTRAQVVYQFLKHDIVDKWATPARGSMLTLMVKYADPVQTPKFPLLDKTVMLARILMDLTKVEPNAVYTKTYTDILQGFKKRLENFSPPGPAGTVIFDSKRSDWETPTYIHAPDTSHANRMIYALLYAYEDGIVFSKEDVMGLSKLLTDVMWNQSTTDPMITNLIDGSNPAIYGMVPWHNGGIWFGFEMLGAYDPKSQKLIEYLLDALIAGKTNQTLQFHNSRYGLLGLAAGHCRNAKLAARAPQ